MKYLLRLSTFSWTFPCRLFKDYFTDLFIHLIGRLTVSDLEILMTPLQSLSCKNSLLIILFLINLVSLVVRMSSIMLEHVQVADDLDITDPHNIFRGLANSPWDDYNDSQQIHFMGPEYPGLIPVRYTPERGDPLTYWCLGG